MQVKPMNSGVAGIKRKFETGFSTGDDKSHSDGLIKKSRKDWSCSLCQVKTTCEQGLKDHLKGRKHKARERELRRSAKRLGKSISKFDPVAEETDSSIDYAMCTGSLNPHLSNCPKEKEEEGIEEDQQAKDIHERCPIDETTAKFWCKMCYFGTTSEELMTAHRMGEKHMTLLQENGGAVIAIKTMPDNVEYVHKAKDTTTASEEGKDEERADEEEKEHGEIADEEEKANEERADEEENENGAEFAIISPI